MPGALPQPIGNRKMIRLALLNLMPDKDVTEANFARAFAKAEEPVEFVLTKMKSHVSKHRSEHDGLYVDSVEMRKRHDSGDCPVDGFVFSGAPFDYVWFDDVDYWPEACELMDWLRERSIPTLYVCWGAQAALHHFYGISRYEEYVVKLSGVYPQQISEPLHPLFEGIAEPLCIPHSRHTTMTNAEIDHHPAIRVLARSERSGISIAENTDGTELYLVGHQEYALDTLDKEYHRDIERGENVQVPEHYYENDNPALPVVNSWQDNGQRMFSNWLNYMIRQRGNR